jgi:hypothetical protein
MTNNNSTEAKANQPLPINNELALQRTTVVK